MQLQAFSHYTIWWVVYLTLTAGTNINVIQGRLELLYKNRVRKFSWFPVRDLHSITYTRSLNATTPIVQAFKCNYNPIKNYGIYTTLFDLNYKTASKLRLRGF
jgi:hypothetical protein